MSPEEETKAKQTGSVCLSLPVKVCQIFTKQKWIQSPLLNIIFRAGNRPAPDQKKKAYEVKLQKSNKNFFIRVHHLVSRSGWKYTQTDNSARNIQTQPTADSHLAFVVPFCIPGCVKLRRNVSSLGAFSHQRMI